MRVVHLSTTDVTGGASRAAYRIHDGLRRAGVDSRMLVRYRSSEDGSVTAPAGAGAALARRMAPWVDGLPLRRYPRRPDTPWSVGWVPGEMSGAARRMEPDVVNVHWVGGGFLPVEAFPGLPRPLVWTLHDMWALTGGCHYAEGCTRYHESCGACPQLASADEGDLSRRGWRRKRRAWREAGFTVVAPSRWMASCARDSSLLRESRVELIPYGIDLDRWRPASDRAALRARLGLPLDKRLVLFGAAGRADDPRKGLDLLLGSLGRLAARVGAERMELVRFGSAAETGTVHGIPIRGVGQVHDEGALAELYAAADVFVAPSRDDNLPNTVLEALACGTPCVAFAIGGMPDLVEHERTGVLVRPFSTDDLAEGIAWVLEQPERRAALSRQAREKAERDYDLRGIAARYRDLYQELLA